MLSDVAVIRTIDSTKDNVCFGQRINFNAIIVPAHCVIGANTQDLEIYSFYPDPTGILRGVSNIFIHPEYTPCNGKNGLAILTVGKSFHVDSDTICLANKTMEFASELCFNKMNSYTDHIHNVEVEERCRSISPLNLDEKKDIGEQICKLKKQGINALQYHYSSFQLCSTHGPNEVRYLYTYETTATICEDENVKAKLLVEHTNKIYHALPWINKVANGDINYNDIDYNGY